MVDDVTDSRPDIAAIDLFCGAGGLSHGLNQAGIAVVAGIDIDSDCRYPFEANIGGTFVERDIREVEGADLDALWGVGTVRLLAGCAPCQPFSPYRRGKDTSDEDHWPLLSEFGRLVAETNPDLVTMENVPRIRSAAVFLTFVEDLRALRYEVDWRSCNGPDYGLAQSRRRLVLVASRHGPIRVPHGARKGRAPRTVKKAIGHLPAITAGGVDPADALHRSRALSPLNLKRIRASKPGGTWESWPEELRAACHRRATGATFRNVYARMEWEQPAPTITTYAYNFGTGRFGHPEQDRPISLREAAMLQGFPRTYRFVGPKDPVRFNALGRLIGNAVPPPIGHAIGRALLKHIETHCAVVAAAAK
jgi:DNA (cytosine-5)-methyltransferase 1